MSKTMMWDETDSKGFESECLFNEDSRSFEVMVCTSGQAVCRSESFLAAIDPAQGMGEEDRLRSMMIAERLVADIERDLGDH
ncbi:hypothetical protein [Azospirillum canadense]|uniref:hypothetical protein n=1 Tax=Azospirillum canadense TaxID=403962 RepID=UPI002227EBCB|nr:hypothetical protein [Azospirillum canadense]MCW2242186.1 hypothetical protein [Azospirillum canadense]